MDKDFEFKWQSPLDETDADLPVDAALDALMKARDGESLTVDEEGLVAAAKKFRPDLVSRVYEVEGGQGDDTKKLENSFVMPAELDGVTAENADTMQLYTLLDRYSPEQRQRIIRELARRVDAA